MESEKEKLEGNPAGKAVNPANGTITDEEVDKILKSAKEQIEDKTRGKSSKNTESKKKAEEKSVKDTGGKHIEKNEEKVVKDIENKEKTKKSAVKDTKKASGNTADTADERMEKNAEVFVDSGVKTASEKVSVGRFIGTVLEGIWTGVKLIVVVGMITAVVGFLLSRSLLVRGRNGNRECLSGMTVSGKVAVNKADEDEKVEEWLKTVTRKKITLEADDKSILVARKIVVDKESDKWAVILHGYNGSMEDVYDIAMHYALEGYNIVTPDLRANGESEGAFLGMGWLDRLDVINWIDVILEENPSAQVVIHGVDIGADTALMLSGEPLKSSIKAIVAEGAYTNAWDVTKKEYKARYNHLPVFPFMHMMTPVMKVWAGYSLKEADAVKQVKKATVPILLICGQNDTYASENMTKKLNQAIASTHEILTIGTGTHGDCRYAEPESYYDKTFEFIENYVD